MPPIKKGSRLRRIKDGVEFEVLGYANATADAPRKAKLKNLATNRKVEQRTDTLRKQYEPVG